MPHPVTELSAHYIICGYGRVGHEVAAGLRRRNHSLVAIDREPAALANAGGIATIAGDATDDIVLTAAGIMRARGLVAGTGSDIANLAIALSARALNANLLIVARANQPESEAKLLRAGATRAVSPYAIGAHRMATQLVSPGLVAFLDALRDGSQVDLWIEEATVGAGSPVAGQLVRDAVPRSPGLPNLIALRRGTDGRIIANPPPDVRLAPGAILILVGSRHQLRQLIAHASPLASAVLPTAHAGAAPGPRQS